MLNSTAHQLWDHLENRVTGASLESIQKARAYRDLIYGFNNRVAAFVRGQAVLSNEVRNVHQERLVDIQRILGAGMRNSTDAVASPEPAKPRERDLEEEERHTGQDGTKEASQPAGERTGADVASPEPANPSKQDEEEEEEERHTGQDSIKEVFRPYTWIKKVFQPAGEHTGRDIVASPEPASPSEQDVEDEGRQTGQDSTKEVSQPAGVRNSADAIPEPPDPSEQDLEQERYPDQDSATEVSQPAGVHNSTKAVAIPEPLNPSEQDLEQDRYPDQDSTTEASQPAGTLSSMDVVATPEPAHPSNQDTEEEEYPDQPSTTEAPQYSSTGKSQVASPTLELLPDGEKVFSILRCAFAQQTFDCPVDSRIRVVYALWSRDEEEACKGETREATFVADPLVDAGICSPNATDVTARECDGKEKCTLPEDGGCSERPFKTMRLTFKCIE